MKPTASGVRKKTLKAAASPMVEALAAHSWAEADAALARAWRESVLLDQACTRAQRSRAAQTQPAMAKKLEGIEAQTFLLRQELDQACAARGLVLFGHSDLSVRYDPSLHELPAGAGKVRKGAAMRVVSPGVRRGEHGPVLAPATVRPAPVKRAKSAKNLKVAARSAS